MRKTPTNGNDVKLRQRVEEIKAEVLKLYGLTPDGRVALRKNVICPACDRPMLTTDLPDAAMCGRLDCGQEDRFPPDYPDTNYLSTRNWPID